MKQSTNMHTRSHQIRAQICRAVPLESFSAQAHSDCTAAMQKHKKLKPYSCTWPTVMHQMVAMPLAE